MKKIFVFTLMAAAMLGLSACGNKTGEGNEGGTEAVETITGITYDGAKFSITYPEGWKETWASEETLNASSEDGTVKLDATFNDMGPALSELGTYAENWTGMMENQGSTVEKPKIDGKLLTIRSIKDGEVNYHFVIMKEDKIGIAGSLKYPEAQAAEWDGKVAAIAKSVAFK